MSKTYRYNVEAPSEAARKRRLSAAIKRLRRDNPSARTLAVEFAAQGQDTREVRLTVLDWVAH